MARACRVGDIEIGRAKPLVVIAGPCALESRGVSETVARAMLDACEDVRLPYIFKASFDKANRTSAASPRGPGIEKGLGALADIRDRFGVPVTTDVHMPDQAVAAARVVDMLQIPAFLCRQTDLLLAAGEAAGQHDRAVNVKKGQFVSPAEMVGPVEKLAQAGCENVILTERGSFFGYHRLVNDFVGFGDLMELGVAGGAPPVCFDCTHSTQMPGAGASSGGRPERAPLLARAAVAAGAHALFVECHPDPPSALSDASSMLTLEQATQLVGEVARLRAALENAPV